MIEYKTIPLTRGKKAIVDLDDFYDVDFFKWRAVSGSSGKLYAETGAKGKIVTMSNFLLEPPKGMVVDHINGNTLDNRRANLRIATVQQNVWNSRKKMPKSGYRGVYQVGPRLFQAQIMCSRKKIVLGSFRTPQAAARRYDRAAMKYFGEFAVLNFPESYRALEEGATLRRVVVAASSSQTAGRHCPTVQTPLRPAFPDDNAARDGAVERGAVRYHTGARTPNSLRPVSEPHNTESSTNACCEHRQGRECAAPYACDVPAPMMKGANV